MGIDGRASRAAFAHTHDILVGTTETAPESARTLHEGLTVEPTEEVQTAMNDRNKDELRRIAGEYLTRARDDFERAVIARIRYVKLARQYGMTNQAIGDLLGVGEAAVRGMIARSGGDA